MCSQEFLGVALLRGLTNLPSGCPTPQRRVRLNRQSVDREVGRLEREGKLKVTLPVSAHRLGYPGDQVHGEIGDSLAAEDSDSLGRPLRIVASVHPVEHPAVKRLNAQGNPVHPCRVPGTDGLGTHILRISL